MSKKGLSKAGQNQLCNIIIFMLKEAQISLRNEKPVSYGKFVFIIITYHEYSNSQ